MEQRESFINLNERVDLFGIYLIFFILVFFVLSFRPVGMDNDSLQYEKMIFNFIKYNFISPRIEPTFYIFVSFFSQIFTSDIVVRLVFILYAFLELVFLFIAFRMYSSSPLYSLFLYGLSYFFLIGFNQIRGGVAISIFLLALRDFYLRRSFIYYSKMLVAFIFHYMSLIFMVVYFISKIKNKIFWTFLPVTGILINIIISNETMGLPYLLHSIESIIESIFPLYQIISSKLGHKQFINIFNVWNILLILDFILFSWIVFKRKISNFDYSLWKIFSFSIFIYHVLAASGYIVLVYRISEALNSILLILIPNMILKYGVKPKYLFILLFIAQYMYYFYHLIVNTKVIHF